MVEVETKRKALGKGLEQLFTNERLNLDDLEKNIVKTATPADIVKLPIEEIRPNPYQPRKTFNEEALKELASSLKEHGVIEPIIVKRSIKGYEIVAGERRTRAAKLAGMKKIPAIIRDFNDEQMMEIALIENIQRENLNPIEEAKAYDMIIKTNDLTQEEVAKKFGKSRSYITNILGLISLPEFVQDQIAKKTISMSHARAISKLSSSVMQIDLTKRIIDENLSVRDLEKITSGEEVVKKNKINRKVVPSFQYRIYERALEDATGSKIKINNKKIEISYDSIKDLERILEIFKINVDKE